MELVGLKGLVTIIVNLGMIWLAFYAISELKIQNWFRRPPKTLPLLIVLLATGLGYLNASFLLTILNAIYDLHNLI